MHMLIDRDRVLFPLLLVALIALFFLGAPHGGDFFWSDSPRHALNGVFVYELLRDMPLHDPSGYAYTYYAKYPALTILFYPPFFYLFSAPFYWLFGVSQGTALFAVFVLYAAFGVGSYRLFRYWLTPGIACCAAAALVLAPEIAFWGRQVMLEVPAFAFLTWSAVFFTQFRRTLRATHIYLAAAFLVVAMYTKITTAFLAPVYLITLLFSHRDIFRNRHLWFAGLLSIVTLIPLLIMTAKFGQANMQSVSGIADAEVSRASISGWLWYLKQIPAQTGWPCSIAALVALACLRRWQRVVSTNRGDFVMLAAWLIVGYLFFSSIDLKEARHSIFILTPVVLAPFAGLSTVTRPAIRGAMALLLGAAVVLQTALWRPVFFVDGYTRAVQEIARVAPKNSAVLFSGYRDGAFIFDMRAYSGRPDLSVIRADKILLRVSVRRELGVEEKSLTEAEITDTLDKLGVQYVVAQPGFWSDLEAMRRFERVLASPHFERVTSIPTPANYNAHETELVIYRNRGQVAQAGSTSMRIELPMINRTIQTTPVQENKP